MTEASIRLSEQANMERRLRAIPDGILAWKAAANNGNGFGIHATQVAALDILMGELSADQADQLKAVTLAAAGPPFSDAFYELLQRLSGAQDLWRIFHIIVTQRDDEKWRPLLDIADLIANDCYSAAMRKIQVWGLRPESEVRAPPLTYLESSMSPSTAGRGESVQSLGFPVRQYRNRMLPIPIVLFPFDQAGSIWMMCSISHEVGHNLDHDLEPAQGRRLTDTLKTKLIGRVSDARALQWRRWMGEMFADAIGVLFSGEGFAVSMAYWTVPLGPATAFQQLDDTSQHPPFHLRLRLLAELLIATNCPELIEAGRRMRDLWTGLNRPAWQQPYEEDVPAIADLLMAQKLEPLQNHSVRDLQGNLSFEYRLYRDLADHWNDPGKTRPNPKALFPFPFRLVPGAAALAVAGMADLSRDRLEQLQSKAVDYFNEIPRPEMLGSDEPHLEYLRTLSRQLSFTAAPPPENTP